MQRAICIFLAATGLAACATPTSNVPMVNSAATAEEAQRQAEYLLEARLAESARLNNVSAKLFTANETLCPFKKPALMASFATVYDLPPGLRKAASRVIGLNDIARVFTLIPEGPAALAGLQEGDELVSVNGVSIPAGSRATGKALSELNRALEKNPKSVQLQMRRGAELLDIEVIPRMTCGYDVYLDDVGELNAYADGKTIHVSRGILRLADTDEELALIVAHELAHNTEGHIAAKRKNATVAGLGGLTLDVLATASGANTNGAFTDAAMRMGSGYASAEFESEADYVGMYFMARAGFDTSGVEKFWRKMSIEHPDAIFIKSTHPANPERYLTLKAAHEEIAAKKVRSEPLLPNKLEPAP